MSTARRPSPLASCTLEVEACCATARPADGGASFAVGSYTQVDQQHRTGVLYFFDAALVSRDTRLQVPCALLPLPWPLLHTMLTLSRLQPVAQVRTSGIFEARWGPGDGVALACSDGTVALCATPCAPEAPLVSCALCAAPEASMCTSVDWRGSADALVACGQDGRAHLLQLREACAARAGGAPGTDAARRRPARRLH